jgi:hypothetical protein
MSALAPEKFAQWMATHEHVDKKLGFVYRNRSRIFDGSAPKIDVLSGDEAMMRGEIRVRKC